ncbi:MAG: acetyl-CoA carboxylase, biotin carboxyl carrier protein [Rubrivivax sp. SCN 71-131]|nr:MAG: acetyl-CoA carboxylase, biotin carboxyl carrier protein [Rubrivivax sp. SCN 71-131]
MSLSHDDVERIIRLLEASPFDELHLELEGMKLDLRRRGAAASVPPAPDAASLLPDAASLVRAPAAATGKAPAPAAACPPPGQGCVDVRAPMLGTFFHAPKPGADPFVSVGSQVEPETVIGIVEVMKLMNSVAAGVRGEVVEILAPDAQLVEYDQVLVRVRPL